MKIAIFLFLHWYGSLFLHTFFHHRYASHKMFRMNQAWEKVFFILCYIFHGAAYLSPKVYGIMHRQHHAYTDTELDPHSPKYSRNLFELFWKTRLYYNDILYGRINVEENFTRDLPEWDALDRIGNHILSRIMWVGIHVFIYTQLVTASWMFVFLPLTVLMVPIQGLIINWFAHKVGSINFSMKNTSTNLFRMDWLMMGEGYHNNHHKFPGKANFGYKPHEIDVTYLAIRALLRMGIIYRNG